MAGVGLNQNGRRTALCCSVPLWFPPGPKDTLLLLCWLLPHNDVRFIFPSLQGGRNKFADDTKLEEQLRYQESRYHPEGLRLKNWADTNLLELQEKVQNPTPGEEQPQASGRAAGGAAGKQFVRKAAGGVSWHWHRPPPSLETFRSCLDMILGSLL